MDGKGIEKNQRENRVLEKYETGVSRACLSEFIQKNIWSGVQAKP